MPKKQPKKTQKSNKLLLMFYSVLNLLVLLGYIIMYPFEKLLGKLSGYFARSKKPRKEKHLKVKKRKKTQTVEIRKLDKRKVLTKKNKKNEKRRKLIRVIIPVITFLVGIIFSLVFIMIPSYVYSWYRELPQPDLLDYQANNQTTKILDRKGRLLYEIYIDKKYNPVDIEEIPSHVVNATLSVEDASFYSHHGFDFPSIMRAAKAIVMDNELQGGSTITQQLVKNVLLTPERTFERKAKELVLSVLVEQKYTKDEILELYLNNIPYGGTAYGIQSASQKYFDKDVNELTLGEASLLAGLPSAPSAYSPVQGNELEAKARQRQVLNLMVERGYITAEEAEKAYSEELIFAPQIEYIRAPHFVEYVRRELYTRYGQRSVDFGGLTVQTTLDLELQDKVQIILAEEVENGERYNFTNGAAVVLDSKTGGVLAYVGSVDYFSGDDGNYDVVTAFRQPGSSIKPITYAAAFEKGFTTVHTIRDSAVTYQSYGQTYSPKNYDGKYHGLVTLRQALANSYNIPAVKLLDRIGIDEMVSLGKKMGFDYWEVGDGTYGLSITLGGKEVRLLDLTNAYATFSRQGVFRKVTPLLSVKDIYGFEIYSHEQISETQVIKPQTAFIITNILSDNEARIPAFGPNSQLVIPGHTVAVKTGTTNDIRDNLTIGYTPSYTVGVWVGNNDNTPMSRVASGVSGAAPIWNRVMRELLSGFPPEPFIAPDSILIVNDKSCGITEVFDKGSNIPSKICVTDGDEDEDLKPARR
jgi:1A family penicillin-binding protein